MEEVPIPPSGGASSSTHGSSWRVVNESSDGETSDTGTTTETERSILTDPVLERIILGNVPEDEIEAAAAWLQRAQVEEDVPMVEKEDTPANVEGSNENKTV
jgi:hypothetical protein